MTTLLRQAFDAAAKLPEAEQDLIASRVLASPRIEQLHCNNPTGMTS